MFKNTVKATAFLIIEGHRYLAVFDESEVAGARVTGVRQNTPKKLDKDQIAIKVTFEVPKAAFEPLMPEAVIVVPESMIAARSEIEGTVVDPDDDLAEEQ